MNLNALRVFAAVVEQRGFSRAAAAIHLSQPAVSKTVRELERRAGLPLLERGARAVRLTEAGAALYERAREIFALERQAEEDLRARRGLEGGVLRIGASTTIATYLLPPVLAEFARRHPAVELQLQSLNTRGVAEALRRWELDVALVEGEVADAGIEVVAWRMDELVVIAPPGHPLAAGGAVRVERLAGERFLLREPGSGTRQVTEAALRAQGLEPGRRMELGSTEAITRAVAAGLGVAVVSRHAVAEWLEAGRLRLVEVEGIRIERQLSRLLLRGRTQSPAAAAFGEMLTQRTAEADSQRSRAGATSRARESAQPSASSTSPPNARKSQS